MTTLSNNKYPYFSNPLLPDNSILNTETPNDIFRDVNLTSSSENKEDRNGIADQLNSNVDNDKGKSAWIIQTLFISLVVSETLTEMTNQKKSLVTTNLLAIITPLSLQLIKYGFNSSSQLKHHFKFNFKYVLSNIIGLLVFGNVIYSTSDKSNYSTLGYHSILLLPGMFLNLVGEMYITPPYPIPAFQNDADIASPVSGWQIHNRTTQDKDSWQHQLVMQLTRYSINFCAVKVGGKFLEAIGIPFSEFLVICGLTKHFAIIAFSMLFNEILGSLLFKFSHLFQDIQPNVALRLLTLIILAAGFQHSKGLSDKDDWVNFMSAFTLVFFIDFFLQKSLGKKVGPSLDNKITSGFKNTVNNIKGCADMLSKGYTQCCQSDQNHSSMPVEESRESLLNP